MGDTVYIYIFFPHKSKSMQLELENCFKKKKNTHLKEAQCTRTSQLDHFMFIETVAVFSALFHGLRCITAQICSTIINVVRSVYLCLFMLFLKKNFFIVIPWGFVVYAAPRKKTPLQKVSLQVKVIKCWINLRGCICTFKPRKRLFFRTLLNRASQKHSSGPV